MTTHNNETVATNKDNAITNFEMLLLKKCNEIEQRHGLDSKNLWNFGDQNVKVALSKKNLTALPVSAQEFSLVSELLHLLVGVEGDFITVESVDDVKNSLNIVVSSDMHESLKSLAEDITPLAKYYSKLQTLINKTSFFGMGQILHAMSSGLQQIKQDYYSSIAHLESMHNQKKLSLHKLSFFITPIMRSMQKLAKFSDEILGKGMRGAKVLSLLHDQVSENSGDEHTQKIFSNILHLAAEPYMEMVKLWIFNGNYII